MVWWLAALTFLWELFKDWLMLFAAPFINPQMLWIIVPVLLSWVFAEFYQEKKGTSLGNAISNGVVVLWVGIDWARTTVNFIAQGAGMSILAIISKFTMSAMMFAYGLLIIIEGIKTKASTRIFGRVRVVTYFVLMLSPIFYDVVQFSWQYLLAIFMFFPVFYFFVELLDLIIPDPKVYEEDKKMGKHEDLGAGATSFGGDLGSPSGNLGSDFSNFGDMNSGGSSGNFADISNPFGSSNAGDLGKYGGGSSNRARKL